MVNRLGTWAVVPPTFGASTFPFTGRSGCEEARGTVSRTQRCCQKRTFRQWGEEAEDEPSIRFWALFVLSTLNELFLLGVVKSGWELSQSWWRMPLISERRGRWSKVSLVYTRKPCLEKQQQQKTIGKGQSWRWILSPTSSDHWTQ